MKIAFISTILTYPWGGADTLWTRAAEAASERGDKLWLSVSPAVAANARISALRLRGAEIHERSGPDLPSSLGDRVARKLRRIGGETDDVVAALSRFCPDLVIISLGGTYDLYQHPAWIDWFARTGARYRLIANWQQENPVFSDADRQLAHRSLALADQIRFVSTRNLQVTRRHLLDPLPQASVIQNPLRWTPADVSPWPASGTARLATVSRLDESKGLPLLLHALAALASPVDWQLSIYGRGPAEEYLRATVAHLRLSERVNFRGYVNDLRSIWAENQLLVSPSLDDGVPMTIPEAMLCARPVLSTAVGGAEDWLRDGVTGFLCAAPTLPLLTAALERALAVRSRWAAMGEAAAVSAKQRYLPDDFLQLIA
jgi:glycosyltransferase involved in cell wall biosynthesis